ncbi:MAG: ABC transporter ATP-binding protein [Lachnospiraceae bacterium]|nr:ABC transporter ATP-binding protein [Lachnospiraceae bacterium]
MESILKLENVSKKYGNETVLKNVNLELKSGEIVGLVGPNGAGKSTIMKIISGLISNFEGTAQINGENIRNMKCNYKKVGCLIENPGYYGSDTGLDNLKFCAKLSGAYSEAQIMDLAKRMGIEYALKKRVSKYSLGMKQKLGICMAMVGKPEVLILDEPTNGLDPDTIPVVRDLIKYSAEEMKCAVLVSSHILSEIEAVCDSVYFIKNGEIISEKGMGTEERTVYSFTSDSQLKLIELLQKMGYKATVCGDKVETEMDETQASEFLVTAVKENIRIFGMDKKNANLEQTYHKVMEGKDE